MQCFPKSRAVPTKAEDKRPQLLGTNALEEEACMEFPEKGPWFLLVYLPLTTEVSVLEMNKHPAAKSASRYVPLCWLKEVLALREWVV